MRNKCNRSRTIFFVSFKKDYRELDYAVHSDPLSGLANRLSAELMQNSAAYNVEDTNNIYAAGRRVRGFLGIEVVRPSVY